MKYAIISLNDNLWQFETDDLAEAERTFFDLRGQGEPVVLVEVLRGTDGDVQ